MIVVICGRWLLIGKELDRILWGNGNVLYFDSSRGYIGDVYVKRF